MAAPTLKDIAERAGVSIATASRALNAKDGVSEETRQRVLQAARELHYAPHMAARGLATASTQTIVYVVHERHFPLDLDPFYPIIMHGIESELSEHGYHLMLSVVGDADLRDPFAFKPIAESRVDGAILAGPDIPPRFILALKEILPVVLIDNQLPNTPVDAVQSHDAQGGRIATEHLISHGRKEIVALLGPQEWPSSAARGEGYREAMQQAGLAPHSLCAQGTTVETGETLARQALEQFPHLDAIFAANDAMAIGAMRMLASAGRRVPDDVAIIGFDNIAWSALCTPPLTTIHIFKEELGRIAARRIIERIEHGGNTPPTHTLVSTKLIVRRSCGCAPNDGEAFPNAEA